MIRGELATVLSIGVNLWRESPRRRSILSSRIGLWLGSTVVYALELWFGWQLVRNPGNTAQMYSLAYVLIALYAVALARAWELLGARDQGWLKTLIPLRSVDERRKENRAGIRDEGSEGG